MKKMIFTCTLLLTAVLFYGQQCEVLMESLKGKYEGDCKKGKAQGEGKAEGQDSYEGSFKSGLPDGKGKYTWNNGTVFEGKWSKGLKEGKGIMTYKTSAGKDSVIEGFWKKDVYVGKSEYPYEVITKTKSISDVDVEYKPDAFNNISIRVSNTSGGVKLYNGGAMPQMEITDVQVQKGAYSRTINNNSHYKEKEKIFYDIQFPFRIKLIITGGGNTEEVEIEYVEKGSYVTAIKINQ